MSRCPTARKTLIVRLPRVGGRCARRLVCGRRVLVAIVQEQRTDARENDERDDDGRHRRTSAAAICAPDARAAGRDVPRRARPEPVSARVVMSPRWPAPRQARRTRSVRRHSRRRILAGRFQRWFIVGLDIDERCGERDGPGARAVHRVLSMQAVECVGGIRHGPARAGIGIHHALDRLGEEFRESRRGWRLGRDLSEQGDGVVVVRIGKPALDRRVERGAESPDVGGNRRLFALGELGCEVGRGARDDSGLGQLGVPMGAGYPEIADLDVVILGDEQVARLDVAMHGAALVCSSQTVGSLRPDPRDAFRRQRSFLGHDLRQIPRRDVLHDQPVLVPVLDGVVDRDDVAVIECCRVASLAESAGEVGLRCSRHAADFLDRDISAEDLVAAQPDRAHPALADGSLHDVAAGNGPR